MKCTINVLPFTDPYYIKSELQHYLYTDADAGVTTVLIRLNKHVEWDLDETIITAWAEEAGFHVTVTQVPRKQHLVYQVRRG